MSLIARELSGSYDPISKGVHLATCVAVVDLGLQEVIWQGESKVRPQVLVTWEIPGETITVEGVEKPRNISRTYTNSLDKKAALRRDLEAWLGDKLPAEVETKGFNVGEMLGKPCQLQILHSVGSNGNVYANVASIMSIPKGLPVPPMVGDPILFALTELSAWS